MGSFKIKILIFGCWQVPRHYEHSMKLRISNISTQCCLPHSSSLLKLWNVKTPNWLYSSSNSPKDYPQCLVLFNVAKCEYPGPMSSTPVLLPLSLKANWLFWKLESHSYSPDLHCRSQQVLVPPLSLSAPPSLIMSIGCRIHCIVLKVTGKWSFV